MVDDDLTLFEQSWTVKVRLNTVPGRAGLFTRHLRNSQTLDEMRIDLTINMGHPFFIAYGNSGRQAADSIVKTVCALAIAEGVLKLSRSSDVTQFLQTFDKVLVLLSAQA